MNQEALPPPETQSGNTLAQWYRIKTMLRRRWWVALLTTSLALLYQGYQIANTAPSYVSEAKMMVSPQLRVPEGNIYSEDTVNFFGTQIELMRSREVKDGAKARVRAKHPELPESHVTLDAYQKPKTSTFILTATGADPIYTQTFLNAALEQFDAYKQKIRSDTTDRTGVKVTEQLMRVERERKEAEQELFAFHTSSSDVILKEQEARFGSFIASLENELARKKTELRYYSKLTPEQAVDQSISAPESVPDIHDPGAHVTSPRVTGNIAGLEDFKQARQRLLTLQAEQQDLQKVLRPLHPKLSRMRSAIEQAQRDVEIDRVQSLQVLEGKKKGLEIAIENLEESIQETKDRLLALSGQIAKRNQLQSDVDRLTKLYDSLLMSMENVNLSGAQQELIRVLENATPAYAIRENATRKMLMAGIFGMVVGAGILFVMLRFDDRVSSLNDIEQEFDEIVLGQIPREVDDPRTKHVGLLIHDDPRHIYAESFRNIRSSLVFMDVEGTRPKTILITSATPEEGKSVVATNLAVTMAFAGSKVLLVDADLRRGVVHQIFDCVYTPGLSDVLVGNASWRSLVRDTSYESLKLIPRGKTPQQVGEQLMSPVTDAFLAEVQKEYDYVIIDSPPVLAADDTTSLAPKIDGAIFVIRAGVTSARLARSALDALYQRQVNVLGVVLNVVDIRQPHYYYYKYSGYKSVPEA